MKRTCSNSFRVWVAAHTWQRHAHAAPAAQASISKRVYARMSREVGTARRAYGVPIAYCARGGAVAAAGVVVHVACAANDRVVPGMTEPGVAGEKTEEEEEEEEAVV
jgi:hypothetical protein